MFRTRPGCSRPVLGARQMAIYLLREMTDLSFPPIAKEVGSRDHNGGPRLEGGRGSGWGGALSRTTGKRNSQVRSGPGRAQVLFGVEREIIQSGSLPENLRVGHADGGVLLGHLPSPVLAHEHARHADPALTSTGVAEVTLCLDPGDVAQ